MLLHRPYSLRRKALWLGAGVSPQVVSRRLGHSLDMLFRTYTKVLPSPESEANERIEAALQ